MLFCRFYFIWIFRSSCWFLRRKSLGIGNVGFFFLSVDFLRMIIFFWILYEVNVNGVIIFFYRGVYIVVNMIFVNKDIVIKVRFV